MRWYQFSLRDILAVTTICAILVGWYRDHSIQAVAIKDADERTANAELQLVAERARAIERDVRSSTARARVISCGFGLDLPIPQVEGLITRVHATERMVQINLGSDDGLRVGVKMDIARLGDSLATTKYIGQVKLTRVDKTESVGSIVKLAADGDPIQVRDLAMTALDR